MVLIFRENFVFHPVFIGFKLLKDDIQVSRLMSFKFSTLSKLLFSHFDCHFLLKWQRISNENDLVSSFLLLLPFCSPWCRWWPASAVWWRAPRPSAMECAVWRWVPGCFHRPRGGCQRSLPVPPGTFPSVGPRPAKQQTLRFIVEYINCFIIRWIDCLRFWWLVRLKSSTQAGRFRCSKVWMHTNNCYW